MVEIPAPPAEDPFVVASQVWNVIELQKAGRIDEAVEAWTRLRLPAQTDAWRLIALGYAYLQLAEYERAAEVLCEAKYAAPDNAVLDFVIGTLWLAKAETAFEWQDAPSVDASRLVAWQPLEIAPNTPSMYRLAAVMCFERATKLAGQVNLDEPLLTGEWMVPESDELAKPFAAPTVRDLLSAFGADKFEGRSHLALGVLHTERDVLDHAERHLDRAAALSEPTGAAFRDLGERLEQRGQFGDAMRVFLKSLSHGGGLDTVGKALENGGKALLR
jgi:tetratricopeptide (TPR) repeat protein